MAALAAATLLVFLLQGSHGIFREKTKIKECKDSDWNHMKKSKTVFPCKIHNDTRGEMYVVEQLGPGAKIKHDDICLVPHKLRNKPEGKTLYSKARQCTREVVEHVVGKPKIDKDDDVESGGECSSNQCKGKCIEGKDLKQRIEFPGGTKNKEELVKQVKDKFMYQGDNKICLCKPGKTGINCKEDCPQGNYGRFCMFTCSDDCEDPSACNTKTGICVCKDGYYFEDGECLKDERECDEKLCKPKHGTCVDESKCVCLPTRTGKWCESSCSDLSGQGGRPMYGATCDQTCGHCTKQPCDLESGKCPRRRRGSRCLPAYKEDSSLKCNERRPTEFEYMQTAMCEMHLYQQPFHDFMKLSVKKREKKIEKYRLEKKKKFTNVHSEASVECQKVYQKERGQESHYGLCEVVDLGAQVIASFGRKRRSSERVVKRKLLQDSPDGSNAGLGDSPDGLDAGLGDPLEELKVPMNITVYFAEENSLDMTSFVDKFSNSYKSKVLPGFSVDKSSIRIGEIQKPLKSRPGRGGEESSATWIFVMAAIVGSVLILAVVLFLVLKCRKQRKPGVQARQNTRAYSHYPVAAYQLSAYRSFEVSQL